MKEKIKCRFCAGGGARACPALQGAICPSCCAKKRGSSIACPAECAFYPFGISSYSLMLRLDAAWLAKAADYVLKHIGKLAFENVMDDMRMEAGEESEDDLQVSEFTLAVEYALFRQPDADGRALCDKWESEGWPGLTNDEKIMTGCHRNGYATIIEVQRILDGERIECRDALADDAETILVFDRKSAEELVRFDRLLTWVTPYPCYARIGPAGIAVAHFLYDRFLDELRAKTRRLFQRRPGAAIKQYLAEHFGETCGLLADLQREWTQRMLNNLDLHQCLFHYRIIGSRAEVLEILNSKPDFEIGDESEPEKDDPPGTLRYVWLRRGESKEIEKDMPTAFRHDDERDGVGSIGSVKVHGEFLTVETISKQKFEFARRMIKKYFGSLLKPEGESVVDLAKQMAGRRFAENEDDLPEPEARASQPAPVPPEIEEKLISEFNQRNYKKMMDDSIPMLRNMTPRQAARDPAMRPLLLDWMKLHLNGIERTNRERGFSLNINWVLDELGLDELKQSEHK